MSSETVYVDFSTKNSQPSRTSYYAGKGRGQYGFQETNIVSLTFSKTFQPTVNFRPILTRASFLLYNEHVGYFPMQLSNATISNGVFLH